MDSGAKYVEFAKGNVLSILTISSILNPKIAIGPRRWINAYVHSHPWLLFVKLFINEKCNRSNRVGLRN